MSGHGRRETILRANATRWRDQVCADWAPLDRKESIYRNVTIGSCPDRAVKQYAAVAVNGREPPSRQGRVLLPRVHHA